jgi:hypothetical protein
VVTRGFRIVDRKVDLEAMSAPGDYGQLNYGRSISWAALDGGVTPFETPVDPDTELAPEGGFYVCPAPRRLCHSGWAISARLVIVEYDTDDIIETKDDGVLNSYGNHLPPPEQKLKHLVSRGTIVDEFGSSAGEDVHLKIRLGDAHMKSVSIWASDADAVANGYDAETILSGYGFTVSEVGGFQVYEYTG